MKKHPFLVSICMITYNHEKYITQAIEGVLMQKTSFPIELVIGEDCSTDDTRIICIEYKRNNPDKINLILPDKNKGMMKNFVETLQACEGKYIALCEGDDYWTDPLKLQKQFDLLEKSDDCVLSFHNAIVLDEINHTSRLFRHYKKTEYKGVDNLRSWLIPTAASFFRNILPENAPEFFKHGTHGDLALFLYLSAKGKLVFINEVMSVYRISDSGITQTAFSGIEHNLLHIRQINAMIAYFGKEYDSLLRNRAAKYYLSTSYLFAKSRQNKRASLFLKKACKTSKREMILQISLIMKIIYYRLKRNK